MLPQLPPWDGLHPLVIHIPIGILLVAPLLVFLGLVWRPCKLCIPLTALLLMIIGTAGAYISVATGEAAAQMAHRPEEAEAVLAQHQQLAEMTRLVFTILTVVYAGIIFGPRLLKREPRRISWLAIGGVYLAGYAAAMLLLVNTGHLGGRLVHEFGVISHYSEGPSPPP